MLQETNADVRFGAAPVRRCGAHRRSARQRSKPHRTSLPTSRRSSRFRRSPALLAEIGPGVPRARIRTQNQRPFLSQPRAMGAADPVRLTLLERRSPALTPQIAIPAMSPGRRQRRRGHRNVARPQTRLPHSIYQASRSPRKISSNIASARRRLDPADAPDATPSSVGLSQSRQAW